MNDLAKFKGALAAIQNDPFKRGIFLADSQIGGFDDVMNRVEGAMNELPNGTVDEIVAAAESAVRSSLGMSE